MTNPTPAPSSGVSAAEIAADITKFAGPAIAILLVILNVVPAASVPGSWQAVLSAVIAALTALQSALSQKKVAAAASAAAIPPIHPVGPNAGAAK